MIHKFLFNVLMISFFYGSMTTYAFAQAAEIWSINEWRLQFPEEKNQWAQYLPQQLKVQTENQFSELGYQQFLLRTGPIWRVTDWLDIAAYSSLVHTTGTQNLLREVRCEFEPTFKGHIGKLNWSNRHRLTYRIFINESGWRYRNRTKLAYPLPDSRWHIFTSDELFLSPNQGMMQNRFLVGLNSKSNTGYTWSLSWQNRLIKAEPEWLFENGIVFSLMMH